jgi:hypothetical protein
MKKEQPTKKDDQYYKELMYDCEKLEIDEFIQKTAKVWFLNRDKIERFMIEVHGRRAKVWNGKLQSKNYWIWGDTGCGKIEKLRHSSWKTNLPRSYESARGRGRFPTSHVTDGKGN